jgi:hypothetical protein
MAKNLKEDATPLEKKYIPFWCNEMELSPADCLDGRVR